MILHGRTSDSALIKQNYPDLCSTVAAVEFSKCLSDLIIIKHSLILVLSCAGC